MSSPYPPSQEPYNPNGGYNSAPPSYQQPTTPPPPSAPPVVYQQPSYSYAPAPVMQPSVATNSTATMALVLSLVGFLFWITAPIGAIMGHIAKSQINKTGEQGRGVATAAIVIGWILTIIPIVLGLIFLLLMTAGLIAGTNSTY